MGALYSQLALKVGYRELEEGYDADLTITDSKGLKMSDRKYRSIRKLIAAKLPEIAEHAAEITARSLNIQPEYFLSLKTAEAIHEHFDSYIFSMEVKLEDICDDAGIQISQVPERYRINGLKRADLVIKHSRNGKFRHVVEFKRGVKASNLLKDAERLAWLCSNVDLGHKMEKNFLVTVTTYGQEVLSRKTDAISAMLDKDFPFVNLKAEYVDLSDFKSTGPKTPGKPLHAMVWEFHYKES